MLPAAPPLAAPVATAPMAAGAAAAVPMCPRCAGPGTWQPAVGRWGCDRCRDYLDAMRPAITAGAAQDAEKAARRARSARMMGVGLLLLIVGIVITSVTHDEAESNGGGTYVVAYGPMIVGGIRFFQGLFGMMA
jgi:hypothetical protein